MIGQKPKAPKGPLLLWKHQRRKFKPLKVLIGPSKSIIIDVPKRIVVILSL